MFTFGEVPAGSSGEKESRQEEMSGRDGSWGRCRSPGVRS